MNLLFFSEPSYPQHPGGAGKCAHLLAAGLAARGHQVWLVCPAGGADAVRERISGVDVHRVPISTRKLIAARREAGTVRISGSDPIRTPRQARHAGLVAIPADRRGRGAWIHGTAAENVSLPVLRDLRGRLGKLS